MFHFQECLRKLQFNCTWKIKFIDRQHTVDAEMKFVMLAADYTTNERIWRNKWWIDTDQNFGLQKNMISGVKFILLKMTQRGIKWNQATESGLKRKKETITQIEGKRKLTGLFRYFSRSVLSPLYLTLCISSRQCATYFSTYRLNYNTVFS